MIRRLRAVLRTTIVATLAWSALGLALGAWGTVATGLPVVILLQSPLIASIGGAIGATGALAVVWLARRARAAELLAGDRRP